MSGWLRDTFTFIMNLSDRTLPFMECFSLFFRWQQFHLDGEWLIKSCVKYLHKNRFLSAFARLETSHHHLFSSPLHDREQWPELCIARAPEKRDRREEVIGLRPGPQHSHLFIFSFAKYGTKCGQHGARLSHANSGGCAQWLQAGSRIKLRNNSSNPSRLTLLASERANREKKKNRFLQLFFRRKTTNINRYWNITPNIEKLLMWHSHRDVDDDVTGGSERLSVKSHFDELMTDTQATTTTWNVCFKQDLCLPMAGSGSKNQLKWKLTSSRRIASSWCLRLYSSHSSL